MLEDAEGLPLIVSVKDTQPHCDVGELTRLLDKRTSQGWQLVGKVFNEASAKASKAWIVPWAQLGYSGKLANQRFHEHGY